MMEEKKLFQEIQGGKNTFHAAVLTSFSFNFHHFEFQVLKTLRQKWISSVLVLADQRMLDDVLGMASGHLKQISQSYSVIGMNSKGAFHPKINFLIGEDKALVFFGSGNISPGGHGKNHELFTGFYVDSKNKIQLPLVVEAWNYVRWISRDIEGYAKNQLLNVLPETCAILKSEPSIKHTYCKLNESTEVALLYNENTTIFEQLQKLIPNEEILKITIVCPYYDESGETLVRFSENFQNSTMDIYLPADFGLPPVNLSPNRSINFFSWEETDRGKKKIAGTENYKRKLHCKIFHFKSKNFEYCLIGSANATIKGLGGAAHTSTNEEFCALYKISGTSLLKAIGVSGPKRKVLLKNYSRNSGIESGENRTTGHKKIHITSVDLNGGKLKVYFKILQISDKNYISIFNADGTGIFKEFIDFSARQSPSIVQLKGDLLKLNPSYLLIEDFDGSPLSNKQLINLIDKLVNTDPTKGNRNIQQLIDSIDIGRNNEFEIIEYLNNLENANKENGTSHGISQSGYQFGKNEVPTSATEMTYEEAVNSVRNSNDHEHIITTHSSTRLWESLSRLFQERQASNEDELMDEEEEAQPELSRDRRKNPPVNESARKYSPDLFKRKIEGMVKLVKQYLASLEKFTNSTDHVIDIIDFSQFLLVTHIFTSICNFSEFNIEDRRDQDNKMDVPFNWEDYLSKHYEIYMMDVIINYIKFCKKCKMSTNSKNEYLEAKLKDYSKKVTYHLWVYLYLLDKNPRAHIIPGKIELIGLNLFHYLGEPDDGFEIYLNGISTAFNDLYFNPYGVVRLKDKMKCILNSLGFNEQYIYLNHSGICKISEINRKGITYISLYGKNHVNADKVSKL